jgi:hypothetical protein
MATFYATKHPCKDVLMHSLDVPILPIFSMIKVESCFSSSLQIPSTRFYAFLLFIVVDFVLVLW